MLKPFDTSDFRSLRLTQIYYTKLMIRYGYKVPYEPLATETNSLDSYTKYFNKIARCCFDLVSQSDQDLPSQVTITDYICTYMILGSRLLGKYFASIEGVKDYLGEEFYSEDYGYLMYEEITDLIQSILDTAPYGTETIIDEDMFYLISNADSSDLNVPCYEILEYSFQLQNLVHLELPRVLSLLNDLENI